MSNIRLLVLLMVAAGLAAWLAWPEDGAFSLWPADRDTATAPASPVAVPASAPTDRRPAQNPLHGLSAAALPDIVARPLFNPTRAPRPAPVVAVAPPQVEAAAPATTPEVNPADYELLAVSGEAGARVAMVRFAPQNRVYHLRQGQFLEQWQVARIDARSVTLSHDDKTFAIGMFATSKQDGATSGEGDDNSSSDSGDDSASPDDSNASPDSDQAQ